MTTQRPIVWPAAPEAASRLYLGFVLRVVEHLGMQFPTTQPDPIAITRGFIEGALSEADYLAARDRWWSHVDRVGVTDFESRDALIARIAICLLGAPPAEAPRLDEHLSWLFELLGKLGVETAHAERLRSTYFFDPTVGS